MRHSIQHNQKYLTYSNYKTWDQLKMKGITFEEKDENAENVRRSRKQCS